MTLNPYLGFDGACRQAFEFYAGVFGGRIQFLMTFGEMPGAPPMPPEVQQRVMHVTMQVGDQVLQGGDAPPGQFSKPAGFRVAVHLDEVAEAERVFTALSEGGTVQQPFTPTFWAKGFGMAVDRFGTPWIINGGQTLGN